METGTVSDLLAAVLWPAVALIVAMLFRGALAELLDRDRVELTVPGGVKLIAQRSDAAAQAVAAAATARNEDLRPEFLARWVESRSAEVALLGRPARVLWVDDHPTNNHWEKAALEALGMTVELSGSTRDALRRFRRAGPYDVVLTDMSRPPFPRAGYRLIRAMRRRGVMTAVVIYAGDRSPQLFDEAVRHGAAGSTNRPTELIQLVTEALRTQLAAAQVGRPRRADRPG
jgi:CheY-like chemotaxis protein